MGNVLAAPDSLAVRLLDHCRVVEAARLLNVRGLQVGSHITHSAPRERQHPPMTLWKHAEGEIRLPAGQSLLRVLFSVVIVVIVMSCRLIAVFLRRRSMLRCSGPLSVTTFELSGGLSRALADPWRSTKHRDRSLSSV